MLNPSMSMLVLEVKFFIVSKTVAGEVGPSSRFGGVGLGGMKSVGSRVVGLIVLDMDSPIFEKKLLNSLAFLGELLNVLLFIRMDSILLLTFCEFIASFRISQVFFRVFLMLLQIRREVKFFACSD